MFLPKVDAPDSLSSQTRLNMTLYTTGRVQRLFGLLVGALRVSVIYAAETASREHLQWYTRCAMYFGDLPHHRCSALAESLCLV
jgi:hypothetical protein